MEAIRLNWSAPSVMDNTLSFSSAIGKGQVHSIAQTQDNFCPSGASNVYENREGKGTSTESVLTAHLDEVSGPVTRNLLLEKLKEDREIEGAIETKELIPTWNASISKI